MSNTKAAFGIDGTLIKLDNKPNYPVILLFHALEALGCDMIIHSGGGVPYATQWRDKLGVKARCIQKFSEVVDIAVDDMPVDTTAAKSVIYVDTNE